MVSLAYDSSETWLSVKSKHMSKQNSYLADIELFGEVMPKVFAVFFFALVLHLMNAECVKTRRFDIAKSNPL